ncbi:unnamed protein product [Didymodactylos carnosus]|uniref:Uncharacterized protein n=1 Tax=Didymodactylos carnosus TaxID=1234261 RepID=A0A813YJ92_9BILA|nr:unnamed protein product [Didymodactylos carnosus]CAF3670720.1 unnamed protein product [Didymodactylos carnosus]
MHEATTILTDRGVKFDVKKAFDKYQNVFIPLYYHELWNEFVIAHTEASHLQKNVKVECVRNSSNSRIFFGEILTDYADNYNPQDRLFSPYDVILMKINNDHYFGVVVYARRTHVNQENNKCRTIQVHTHIGIYLSEQCSVQYHKRRTLDPDVEISRLTSLTSSKRCLTAINNLPFYHQECLLAPSLIDPYFQQPERSYHNVTAKYFNERQLKAIQMAVDIHDDLIERIHLIHGPPGTGKSKTIAGIVDNLFDKLHGNKKILLCAPSNNACDELLKKILEHCGDKLNQKHIVRVGCRPPESKELWDYFLDYRVISELVVKLKTEPAFNRSTIEKKIQYKLLKSTKIIISTLNYSASSRLRLLYDDPTGVSFLIVDEASQASEAIATVVLSEASKSYNLSQSLYFRLNKIFERQPNPPVIMLNTQYRMNPEIVSYPNKEFYGGELDNAKSVFSQSSDQFKPLFYYNIETAAHSHDYASSAYNQVEAEVVAKFCHRLIWLWGSMNLDDEDTTLLIEQRIGVITPYKGQMHVLEQEFQKWDMSHVEIGSVDSFQGKEKDFILISCVRS